MIEAVKHIFLTQKTGFFAWFFVLYAVAGFATLDTFGVHYDEITQRTIGFENIRFVSGRESELEKHRFFGPLFESAAHLAEQIVPQADIRTALLIRRALLFALFLIAVYGVYCIGRVLFENIAIQQALPVLFATWPRLFAEAHYNSKDVFFLILCVFAYWAALKLLRGEFSIWPFVLAGLAMSIRLSGVFIWFSLLPLLYNKDRGWMRFFQRAVLSVLIVIVSCYAVFPALWLHPAEGFIDLFVYSSKNPWPSETIVAGINCRPGEVTRFYTLLWIGFTVPIGYILLSIRGLAMRLEGLWLSLAILLLLPLQYTVITAPTFYNGWRHMYFLYFPLLLFAIRGLDKLNGQLKIKGVVLAVSLLAILNTGIHFNNGFVYFNALKKLWPAGSFSMDYWGVSTKNAIEKILKEPVNYPVKIYSFTETVALNKMLLKPNDKAKIARAATADSADFIIVLNREGKLEKHPEWNTIWVEKSGKDTVCLIYKKSEAMR